MFILLSLSVLPFVRCYLALILVWSLMFIISIPAALTFLNNSPPYLIPPTLACSWRSSLFRSNRLVPSSQNHCSRLFRSTKLILYLLYLVSLTPFRLRLNTLAWFYLNVFPAECPSTVKHQSSRVRSFVNKKLTFFHRIAPRKSL